jgi:hypothetical protein
MDDRCAEAIVHCSVGYFQKRKREMAKVQNKLMQHILDYLQKIRRSKRENQEHTIIGAILSHYEVVSQEVFSCTARRTSSMARTWTSQD